MKEGGNRKERFKRFISRAMNVVLMKRYLQNIIAHREYL